MRGKWRLRFFRYIVTQLLVADMPINQGYITELLLSLVQWENLRSHGTTNPDCCYTVKCEYLYGILVLRMSAPEMPAGAL